MSTRIAEVSCYQVPAEVKKRTMVSGDKEGVNGHVPRPRLVLLSFPSFIPPYASGARAMPVV
jgi:hypothetical protein